MFINNFNESAIKKSIKVESEMERLADKIIQPIPKPSLLCSPNNLSIAMLNIRSIVNKIEDIRNDKFLQSVDIVCLTETWLTPSTYSSPSIRDNNHVFRVDRTTSRGGGVMISLPQTIDVVQNSGLSDTGIELVHLSITFNNIPYLLFLIYRPPLVPLNNLLSVMSNIVSATSSITQPVIVLGDFNEDIHNNSNCCLLCQLLILFKWYRLQPLIEAH